MTAKEERLRDKLAQALQRLETANKRIEVLEMQNRNLRVWAAKWQKAYDEATRGKAS